MKEEDRHTNYHIVFLGEAGFPEGLAAIQRMTLMGRALLHAGCSATVICRKGVWKETNERNSNTKGNFEGIDYVYTSKSVFKPKGFFKRNIQKVKGLYGEYKHLKYLKKHSKINLAIISNMSVVHALRYRIYGTFLNIPTVINFVEMASSMQDRNSFLTRINDYLFDNWMIKLFDGALPISDKLMKYYSGISPAKPSMKLPILCDFEKFNIEQKGEEESYFLYCGSIAYMQVIEFIIEAYKSISEHENTKLYMIVSGGSKERINLLQQEINETFDNQPFQLFSNIPYDQLVHLYTNAIALLIPLRPTVQDASRFPHKIGEYLASGNPVITTNVGEIPNYFEEGKTALIADSYSINAFAQKMKFVLDNPQMSEQIGRNGKELGLNEFDYKTHGGRLKNFLQNLSNSK